MGFWRSLTTSPEPAPPARSLRKRKDILTAKRDAHGVTPRDLLDSLVSDVLANNPAAARVFIDRQMGCVGCTFAPFETVAEVARVYGLEAEDLARALADAQRVATPPEELTS